MKILCGAPRQSTLIGGEHTVGAAHRIGLNETAEAMAIVWNWDPFCSVRAGNPRWQEGLLGGTRASLRL